MIGEIRLIRTLIGAGGMVAVLTALVVTKSIEERALRKTIAGYVACDTAVTKPDLTASAARCSGAVAAVHRQAVQAVACDAALTAGSRFNLSTACTLPVRTLFAQRDAAETGRARLETTLAEVRRDQGAALARAEARGRSQTQRTQSVQTRLDSAPRTDAGLGRCDAECLQRLGAD